MKQYRILNIWYIRRQFPRGEARDDSRQPDVLPRRGRRARRGDARPRRPAHGLRSDHALFPQPQGIIATTVPPCF